MSELENTVEETETNTTDIPQERDFEGEARGMGWVPQDEYRGPADKWKPAQKFVEDGEKILPIVRAQLKKEREESERKERDFAERMERMERMQSEALRRAQEQHKAELDKLKAREREAVQTGNVEEFDRVSAERAKLEKSSAPADDVEEQKAQFIKDNPWFNSDFDMHTTAVNYSNWLSQQEPSLTFKANADKTVEYMKSKFPEKFGAAPKPRQTISAVDGGGSFSAPVKKSLADKLPSEAMAQARKDVEAKLYPSVDAWAKAYYS